MIPLLNSLDLISFFLKIVFVSISILWIPAVCQVLHTEDEKINGCSWPQTVYSLAFGIYAYKTQHCQNRTLQGLHAALPDPVKLILVNVTISTQLFGPKFVILNLLSSHSQSINILASSSFRVFKMIFTSHYLPSPPPQPPPPCRLLQNFNWPCSIFTPTQVNVTFLSKCQILWLCLKLSNYLLLNYGLQDST